MSADLFAAFAPHVSQRKTNDNKPGQNSDHVTSPDVLIRGFETLDMQRPGDLYQNLSRSKQEDDLPRWRQGDRGTAVLFDAIEDTSPVDDDFGEFEDVTGVGGSHTTFSTATHPTQEATGHLMSHSVQIHDLLDLDKEDTGTTGPTTFQNLQPSLADALPTADANEETLITLIDDDWGDFSTPVFHKAALSGEDTNTTTQPTLAQTVGIEQDSIGDEWDTFKDGEAGTSSRAKAKILPSGLPAAPPSLVPQLEPPPKSNFLSQDTTVTQTLETIRPSNIPPPVILLQLLPEVFDELRKTITQQVRQTPLNSPDSNQRDIALKVVQVFTVAARIIAGRALRWKRDAILAQSMRMGPAASAGGGRGMKLVAVDKSKSIREEKEVADVVNAWEKSAHLFNSTISKGGLQRPLMVLYMSVRPRLTSGLAVLKANHACALCGINREERVPQVEVNVEDSFGDYWIEHWGHRDCRDFWTTYKHRLQQR